jgi:hypothetical protein
VSDDFSDLLSAFAEAGVRFIVVGAYALAAHGVPRVTGDLDLWVESTTENARRVWQALASFGAPLESLTISEEDFTVADRVVQLGVPPYRIDILTSISGIGFHEAWDDRLNGTLFGIPVPFLGRDAFVRNKRASGRMKDLEDIRLLGD